MSELSTRTFYDFARIEPQCKKFFVLDKWAPERAHRVVGAVPVLLCNEPTVEIYICASRNPNVSDQYPYWELKVDHLFYAQRDAYSQPSGIADLQHWQMLSAKDYFKVSMKKPVYIKVGVVNFGEKPIDYDAFITFYYH